MTRTKALALAAALVAAGTVSASAQAPFISEVFAAGSGNGSYNADWFELTNPGTLSLDITGWKMDDNSNGTAKVALRGVTSIAPGQSVVFLEGVANGSTDAAIATAFLTAWYGSPANAPAGLTLGFYGGSGVGLSSTAGDAVNVFDASDALIGRVSFGAVSTGFTLDNFAGLANPQQIATISTNSVAGTNNAFVSVNIAPTPGTAEVGSPGLIPEPGTASLLLLGAAFLGARRRKAA